MAAVAAGTAAAIVSPVGGVSVPAAAQAACGWPLAIAGALEQIPAPSQEHLDALRALHARTDRAHSTHHPLPL